MLGSYRSLLAGVVAASVGMALLGCATAPPAPAGWHAVTLPGKRPTTYSYTVKDGRPAWRAEADTSASLLRRRVQVAPEQIGTVQFSWWVPALIDGAKVSDADLEDSPARVVFAFAGDRDKLSARNRMMFDLARALTGEEPPYATLMYVWADEAHPVGSVVVSGRSDRIRKIVVEAGPAQLGRWRYYRRDLAADYRLAFGEDPGPLVGVAFMTDADNTRSKAHAWYGEIRLD